MLHVRADHRAGDRRVHIATWRFLQKRADAQMSKIMIALAGGAGYVLGAKAGRARYEQITQKVTQLWAHPRVQEGAG